MNIKQEIPKESIAIPDKTETIITNPETIAAIEEGRKMIGVGEGYRDIKDFWEAIFNES